MGFVTNMVDCTPEDMTGIPEEYRKRRRMETEYRDAKRTMPRTTSRNAAIRPALFFLSLMVSNIWMYARAQSKSAIRLTVLLTYMIWHAASMTVWKPPDKWYSA